MKKMLRNKKGAEPLSIFFLTMGALVLCAFALFRFYTGSAAISDSISSLDALNNVYSSEKQISDSLYFLGKNVIVEEYDNFVSAGSYLSYSQKNLNYYSFEGVSNILDKSFSEKISNGINNKISSYSSSEGFPREIGIWLKKGFGVSYKNEKVVLTVPRWEKTNVQSSKGDLIIDYKKDILINFDLEKIGLISFEKLYSIKEECKTKASEGEIRSCFSEKISNFQVSCNRFAREGEKIKSFTVDLVSKNDFFINGEMKKIKLGFLVNN